MAKPCRLPSCRYESAGAGISSFGGGGFAPGEQHWLIFRQMITEGQATGPLVTDAQLAAVTIEHGGILYTTDRDFARFPGLRWKNPLE